MVSGRARDVAIKQRGTGACLRMSGKYEDGIGGAAAMFYCGHHEIYCSHHVIYSEHAVIYSAHHVIYSGDAVIYSGHHVFYSAHHVFYSAHAVIHSGESHPLSQCANLFPPHRVCPL